MYKVMYTPNLKPSQKLIMVYAKLLLPVNEIIVHDVVICGFVFVHMLWFFKSTFSWCNNQCSQTLYTGSLKFFPKTLQSIVCA